MKKEQSSLILYKASAGSGKTYTLAKEYLKIVIQNPYNYNKILAVTFTKKATAEMKSRIIENLTALEKYSKGTEKLRNEIIDEIKTSEGIDVTPVFDKNVSMALQLILHDYSNFNISTIDSFFQSIIRSFAKELDLPIGMEVELDTESVLQHAVQGVLKEYKTDKDALSKWIEEYVFDQIEEDKSWKIEKNINALAKQLLNEDYQELTSKHNRNFDIEIYKSALSELKKIIYNYKHSLDELTDEVLQKINQDNLDIRKYYQAKNSVQSFINSAKKYEPTANSYIQKMLEGGALYSSSTKDEPTITALEAAWKNYIESYILNVLSLKEQKEKQFISAEIVVKNIYALALLEFINQKLKEYKRDNNLVLISDTNQIISLIAQHEEVPFIFEKSATFLKYVMIDEFQDTSTLQWKGMLPLLLEILQNINGLVLIVGDPKQSIYRWRGGNMELIIDGISKGLHHHWEGRKDTPLTVNYRSAKEIVEFNNAFFSAVKEAINLENPLFKDVLRDVEQGNKKSNQQGFIQCKWIEKPKKEDEEKTDAQLLEILHTIQSVYPAKKYSDIAILTRDNKKGALIANFLQENNISVVSAESLLLTNARPIQLLIAAMEYVLHTKEDFYAVKLNYLLAQHLRQTPLEPFLIKHTNSNYFFELKIDALHRSKIDMLSTMALNELVFTLMQALSLDKDSDNYLLRFQDVVFNYTQQYSNSTREFLEYWEEKKEKLSIIPPEGIEAVTIFTIHKSKGLQFPVIIVPYADWSMKPKPQSTIWVSHDATPFNNLQAFPIGMVKKIEQSLFNDAYHRELELNYIDNINLLYVAFTRAEEQLYIFPTKEEKSNDEEPPQNVSRLLKYIIPKTQLAAIENDIFTYGNIVNTEKSEAAKTNITYLEPIPFHNFKTRMPLKLKEEYSDALISGNILHEILSKIKQPEQTLKAIASTAPDEIDAYRATTQKIIELFQQKKWFEKKWQHINERNFIFNNTLLRADRVLLSDDICIIIDYKTGVKKTEHQKQLKEYKEAYTNLFGKNTEAYLLYIDTLEMQEIN